MAMKKKQERNNAIENPPKEGAPETTKQEHEPLGAVPYFPDFDPEPGSEIERIRQKHESQLLAIDGVKGVRIGADEIGDDVIVVMLRDREVGKAVPKRLDGFPVHTEVTGEIDAY